MKKPIYLDHAATAPLLGCVKQKMHTMLDLQYGNAMALHSAGQLAKQTIATAREQVAQLINAEPEEIIFTSGGSEGNNTIMNTFAGREIAISSIEHPSVLEAAKARAGKLNLLKVDHYGRVGSAGISPTSDLISVMLANNELGTLEPIADLVKTCESYNAENNNNHRIFTHTDATQALGKIRLDVKALGIDFLTCSAHKIGGPLGVGIIYCKHGCKLTPLIYGGHQENNLRAGTSNVLAIAGFGEAARWCRENQSHQLYLKQVKPLRDELRRRVLAEIPASSVNSPEEGVLPNILNVSFRAVEGEAVQLYLDVEGIIVGTGSACASGDLTPSHVLMATRHDAEVAHSSIRFSLGLDTTCEDIERVMQVLPWVVQRLRDMSTIKIGERNG